MEFKLPNFNLLKYEYDNTPRERLMNEYYLPLIYRYYPTHLQNLLDWLYTLEILERYSIGIVLSGRPNGITSTIYTMNADILAIRSSNGTLEARQW